MDSKHTNPGANVPEQNPNEPLGDRGRGDKTWSPEQGEQGISNREGDEDPDVLMAEDDAEEEEDEFDDEDEDDDAVDEDEDEDDASA